MRASARICLPRSSRPLFASNSATMLSSAALVTSLMAASSAEPLAEEVLVGPRGFIVCANIQKVYLSGPTRCLCGVVCCPRVKLVSGNGLLLEGHRFSLGRRLCGFSARPTPPNDQTVCQSASTVRAQALSVGTAGTASGHARRSGPIAGLFCAHWIVSLVCATRVRPASGGPRTRRAETHRLSHILCTTACRPA